jgi:hypothetical protein
LSFDVREPRLLERPAEQLLVQQVSMLARLMKHLVEEVLIQDSLERIHRPPGEAIVNELPDAAVQVESAGSLHVRCRHPDLPPGLEDSAEFAQQREEFIAQFEVFDHVLGDDGRETLIGEWQCSRREVHVELASNNIDIDKSFDAPPAATYMQALGPRLDSTRHATPRTGADEIEVHELASSFGARQQDQSENWSEDQGEVSGSNTKPR